MADTINELYLKYVNEVGKQIEDDRYFRYLYEMIQAGENEINQQHQILHKVVDERWLSTIEEALEPLNRIVEQPRRTIVRNEEVVPVSLAKKITADSVRHLSMNTQYIAGAVGDDIHPTHILNVSVDESYDLYENRFIYHLIQRLVTFIDKRTDIIFWSTGDETQNTFSLESKIDDAYEQIEYKLEMKIKNMKSFAENDEDNMDVFMRIDRVRRLVMGLKNSAFCELMAGCQAVKSPIQRTNLLTKDRDYKVCYALWQFLESYDEIGYSIEVENQALEIDEEYLIQMYTNLITNYAVFKSITESDKRNLENVPTRHRTVKPKFVKEVIEEEVADRNIPEVEIRKVFVEEVTQAQLDAEAKLEEEIRLRKEVEDALRSAEASVHSLMMQTEYAQSVQREAEDNLEKSRAYIGKLEESLAKEQDEKNEAYLMIQQKEELLAEKEQQLSSDAASFVQQIEDERSAFAAERESLLGKIAAMENEHEHEILDIKDECRDLIEKTENRYIEKMDAMEEEYAQDREALQMRNEAEIEHRIEAYEGQLSKQSENFTKEIEGKVAFYEAQLDTQFEKYTASLEAQKEAFDKELSAKDALYTKQISEAESEHRAEVAALKQASEQELELVKTQANDYLQSVQSENEKALASVKEEAAAELAKTRSQAKEEYDALKKDGDERFSALERETSEKYAALERSSKAMIAELKTNAEKEMAEAKNTYRDELDELQKSAKQELDQAVAAAKEKEAQLNDVIADLKREMEMLEHSKSQLETQLSNEMSARRNAEVREAEALSKAAAETKLRASAEAMAEEAKKARNEAARALKQETALKETAEKEVQIQKDLLKAVEEKVSAATVGEFIRAHRQEQKLRKRASKKN